MKSAIGVLMEEFERLKNLVVEREGEVDRLRRELRDMRHERDYLQRKLERRET